MSFSSMCLSPCQSIVTAWAIGANIINDIFKVILTPNLNLPRVASSTAKKFYSIDL